MGATTELTPQEYSAKAQEAIDKVATTVADGTLAELEELITTLTEITRSGKPLEDKLDAEYNATKVSKFCGLSSSGDESKRELFESVQKTRSKANQKLMDLKTKKESMGGGRKSALGGIDVKSSLHNAMAEIDA